MNDKLTLRFDFNNMFTHAVGNRHGAGESDLAELTPAAHAAHRRIAEIAADPARRVALGLEWTQLPYQTAPALQEIAAFGNDVAKRYDNCLFLGIGGSYLGLKAAQDALLPPYYNEFPRLRKSRPRIYFDGNNLDPGTLTALTAGLDPRKTFVIVISKSGETTETKVAFEAVKRWLKKSAGRRYGRQICAVTDPVSGSLRKMVVEEQKKDRQSFRSFPLMHGVGGRFSELNMGLVHLAVAGIRPADCCAGAAAMAARCVSQNIYENPALLYAVLHTALYRRKGKSIAVLMPFSESLKSTADWYVQLLAESLGKKYARAIRTDDAGRERWERDSSRVVNVGRTPVAARGTNDLHSIQQNTVEGEHNKVVTFIRVERFASDVLLGAGTGLFAGRTMTQLMTLAQEATEWALVREERPNCSIIMPAVTPHTWGALLYFFEMATAYEGELLDVNAFDQPGVEGYKNYMYVKLRKPDMPAAVAEEIERHPLIKKDRYIV